MKIIYLLGSTGFFILAVSHAFLGIDPLNFNENDRLPENARQAPGGYRTYIYWNSGYQGGK